MRDVPLLRGRATVLVNAEVSDVRLDRSVSVTVILGCGGSRGKEDGEGGPQRQRLCSVSKGAGKPTRRTPIGAGVAITGNGNGALGP